MPVSLHTSVQGTAYTPAAAMLALMCILDRVHHHDGVHHQMMPLPLHVLVVRLRLLRCGDGVLYSLQCYQHIVQVPCTLWMHWCTYTILPRYCSSGPHGIACCHSYTRTALPHYVSEVHEALRARGKLPEVALYVSVLRTEVRYLRYLGVRYLRYLRVRYPIGYLQVSAP